MNFFFGINNNQFCSEIQIPTFQNRDPRYKNISLFKAKIVDNNWVIEKTLNNRINRNFFLLKNEEISNQDIYFLADNNDITSTNYLKLKNFNKFTDTAPAFRCNFKIFIKNGGFSSFQSEYPYSMIKKKDRYLVPYIL